jgi:quinol monooxygenase YgiN
MYSRIISCAIDPSRIEEFRTVLNGELLPRIQEQPGFVENIESLDHTSGEFCCTTLWKSKSDVEAYDSGLFQEIAARLGPMMMGAPIVKNLPVENSSAHQIATGKAA